MSTQEVTGSTWGAAGTGLPQQISQPLHRSFLTPLHPLPSLSILAHRSLFPCPGPVPHWRLPIAESAENGSSKQRAASPRSVNASDVVHERRVREPYSLSWRFPCVQHPRNKRENRPRKGQALAQGHIARQGSRAGLRAAS